MKDVIRNFVMSLGVDDVGFAAVDDYKSPRSPAVESLFPGARSMIVMAFRELSACECPSPQLAMNARLDLIEFTRSACYRVGRYVETQLNSPAVTVPVSYPMDFATPEKRGVGEVSLRHAAIAAGLGSFGLHNLVVHPKFGTRVIFAAVLTKLEITSDPPLENNPCTACRLCIEACPPKVLRLADHLNHYGYHPAEYLGAGCTGCGICFFVCPEPGGITVLRLALRPAAA